MAGNERNRIDDVDFYYSGCAACVSGGSCIYGGAVCEIFLCEEIYKGEKGSGADACITLSAACIASSICCFGLDERDHLYTPSCGYLAAMRSVSDIGGAYGKEDDQL